MRSNSPIIILGIDPGSVRIGIGIIVKNGAKLSLKYAGLLTDEKHFSKNEGERLVYIEKSLKKLICKERPDIASVEKLFFSTNKKTAFPVAHARGIIIKTLTEKNIPILEFSPNQIKLSVTGDGRATKNGVAKMVSLTLKNDAKYKVDDITDALAAAITASFVS
jgi:crossover junction endodeoxyribonuclease RuvC